MFLAEEDKMCFLVLHPDALFVQHCGRHDVAKYYFKKLKMGLEISLSLCFKKIFILLSTSVTPVDNVHI